MMKFPVLTGKRKLLQSVLWVQLIFLVMTILTLTTNGPETLQARITGVGGSGINGEESTTDSSTNSQFKFFEFSADNWRQQTIKLSNRQSDYFVETEGGQLCFRDGTESFKMHGCVCKEGYYGQHCGIPESAWNSYFRKNKGAARKLTPRRQARRIIHGLPVNHEFQLFETRMRILEGLVDAYILLESNYTSYGSPKPLRFLEKFRSGWLSEYQDKILYVFLSFFPKAGEKNGWYADSYIRLYLSRAGIPLIHNTREDDIFLLLDADELPTREALLFLKVFDGWTEPVKFAFRWTVFGFNWLKAEDPGLLDDVPLLGALLGSRKKERLLTLSVACTLGMLDTVYANNGMLLRRNVWEHSLLKQRLKAYTSNHSRPKEWTLGSLESYAGHHCSWCYSPQGIRMKLESAQRHDEPRWGDYPEKLDLFYIQELIDTGGWFDGSKPFIKADRGDKNYAPEYILQHAEEYSNILGPEQP